MNTVEKESERYVKKQNEVKGNFEKRLEKLFKSNLYKKVICNKSIQELQTVRDRAEDELLLITKLREDI